MTRVVKCALVVDDHETSRLVTAEILRRRGWRVLQAASAPEAMRILRDEPPVAVLTDLNLPGASGIELARWICDKWPRQAARPVLLAMTADPEPECRRRAAAAGIERLLRKPVSARDLRYLDTPAPRGVAETGLYRDRIAVELGDSARQLESLLLEGSFDQAVDLAHRQIASAAMADARRLESRWRSMCSACAAPVSPHRLAAGYSALLRETGNFLAGAA